MVVLGLVQAGFGAVRGQHVFAGLGVVYALTGGAFLWFEVYAVE